MRIGELCAGYGGISLGLALAGEDVDLRWLAEVDPALDPLHPPGVPNLGDITQVDWSTVERVDLVTAGFPCQPFSAAGAQLAEADPRYLWPAVRGAIAALLPPRVLLENVRNLVGMRKGEIWRRILDDLTSLGYDVTWLTLGACRVGAAHHRHRVFALATHVRVSPDGWLGPLPTKRLDIAECGAAGRVGPSNPSCSGLARLDLLPTPTTRDGDGRGTGDAAYWAHRRSRGRDNGLPLDATLALLPTPTVGDARGSRNETASATQPQHWGRFAAAIERHAAIFGPPPSPTEPNRNGAPRLSAAFAEWLMCVPAGHVTDALPRRDALKAIGNGVCPPQLAAAWRLLIGLDRPNDTSIGFGAMTTSTSADVKEIQDRNAAARGRVVQAGRDALGDVNILVDIAIEAAMMELAAVWREEAAHVTTAKRKGHISIAKEYTQAAARLAGFAVGLTTRPIIEPSAGPWKTLDGTEYASEAERDDVSHVAYPFKGCERHEQCRALSDVPMTVGEAEAYRDPVGLRLTDEILAALPEGDPVAAVFSSPTITEVMGEPDEHFAWTPPVDPAARFEIIASDKSEEQNLRDIIGPSLPGDPGYTEAEHDRPKAPCYECVTIGEDPAPWCDCYGMDEMCKGPCRKRAHTYERHPQGCSHVVADVHQPAGSACPYCGAHDVSTFTKIGTDPFGADQSEEQNLRDIIGPMGASTVTATIDHPFTNPGVPWLNQRRAVEIVPFAGLSTIAAATPPRDHVSHSYVQRYESCSLSAMLGDASRAGQIGATRPIWGGIGGTALHHAVENIERAALSGVSLVGSSEDVDALWMSCFDAAVKEELAKLVGTPYADSATWYISNRGKEGFDWWLVEGAKMLGLYVKHHTNEWRAANATFLLQDTTPVIELEYDMSLRSLDGERGLRAKGFVDRATLDMSTYSLTVLDYKTGSREPESTFQLGEYGHALLMAMGIAQEPADRPILGRYWLARKGIYTDPVPVVTRHPLSELQYRYDAAARGTQAKIFAPHVTNLCKSCPVTDYCPASIGRS